VSVGDKNDGILQAIGGARYEVSGAVESGLSEPIDDIVDCVLAIRRQGSWTIRRRVAVSVESDNCDTTAVIRQCD
jgi:hypothetical protein